MILDSSNPSPNSQERYHTPEDTSTTESVVTTSSEGKEYTAEHLLEVEATTDGLISDHRTWCYIFVHHRQVDRIEAQLKKDGQEHFIHRTLQHIPDKDNPKRTRKEVRPSISGLIFLKGDPQELQRYLDDNLPGHRLCHDHTTGRVARIPDSQMHPFMRLAYVDPERISILLRPLEDYARNHTLVRITTGLLAGLTGYIVRLHRDRRLIFDAGGQTIAISHAHQEAWEEMGSEKA